MSIIDLTDEKYPSQFYYIVSKDPQSTGNLEMSIERKDNDTTMTWVHRKRGNSDGFPSSDWNGFEERLGCGIQKVNGETCDVSGVVSASESEGPNHANQIVFSMIVSAIGMIGFVYV